MKSPIAAIVLCAGKGTRMKSARAKVLHPLLGRPMGAYPLERALELGASRIVPVVGHQAETVEATLRESLPRAPLAFAAQTEQRGTADAVLSARAALRGFSGEIFILYGDVPLVRTATLKALQARKRRLKAPLAFITTRPPDPTGYGRVLREGDRAVAIVEHKDATHEQRAIGEVNAGLYLVDSERLWKLLGRVEASNAQRELYLTDLVSMTHRGGERVATIEAPFEDVSGINDRIDLSRAVLTMRTQINEAHMLAGVTFEDPATTLVEGTVKLGADVTLGPGCTLAGATRLGRGVRVGQGAILRDAIVGDDVDILPYTLVEGGRIGRGAKIGPFARVRPGTELAEDVHLGNFVETKKARLGKGSKASHLSYLGDCEIGRDVNVGAGTITCNYDGVAKHRTVLGDRVFVGSDTQFVAPVSVGADAVIGAGSCIVEDVPPGSLAIARGRQIIKTGWSKRKRVG